MPLFMLLLWLHCLARKQSWKSVFHRSFLFKMVVDQAYGSVVKVVGLGGMCYQWGGDDIWTNSFHLNKNNSLRSNWLQPNFLPRPRGNVTWCNSANIGRLHPPIKSFLILWNMQSAECQFQFEKNTSECSTNTFVTQSVSPSATLFFQNLQNYFISKPFELGS